MTTSNPVQHSAMIETAEAERQADADEDWRESGVPALVETAP